MGAGRDTGADAGRRRAWAARLLVWPAFAATAALLGPRALAVLQSRAEAAGVAGPAVELDRVGFLDRPDWVDERLLVAIARDLQPWLAGSTPILDEENARRLLAGLCAVPWVVDARLECVFPDRFRVHLGLRRPVLAVRDEVGRPLCLVDRAGVALPWVDGLPLPATVLRPEGGGGSVQGRIGEVVPDERVPAAAAVAVEWRDHVAPVVPDCPRLLEVDTTNLGERWLCHPEYPEVRVVLARGDGAPVVFGYGRPCHSDRPRVPVATKAGVLRKVLSAHPGLRGLVAGDLRFEVRWRSLLHPRQGS